MFNEIISKIALRSNGKKPEEFIKLHTNCGVILPEDTGRVVLVGYAGNGDIINTRVLRYRCPVHGSRSAFYEEQLNIG